MKRLLDILWLVLLGAFVFAIPPTFHGDEAMLIYTSHDYVTAFIDRNPAALVTEPPYPIDSDEHLRLINGTLNRYAFGLSWHLAGLTVDDLPPRPGWDWGLDYDTNISTGHMPLPALLSAARLSSSLFLALSVVVMFALGWLFGGRRLAYLISALYVVNPIILLNGRRAMQEGIMLFFGLLVILIAALISKRREESETHPHKMGASLSLWLALILAGGLALASKHTGIVYVAGALGWIFVAELVRLNWHAINWRRLLVTALQCLGSAVLIIALFVGLSPALWEDPPARFVNLLQARAELLDIQVAADPIAPTSLVQRVEAIVTQPFLTPPQHFEAVFWANFPAVMNDVAHYMASPFSGLQFGLLLGGALTMLAGLGILVSIRRLLSRHGLYAGLLVWFLVIAASLLANPLPWQRYYLPFLPLATLLAGVGIDVLLRRFVWKRAQPAVLSRAAS